MAPQSWRLGDAEERAKHDPTYVIPEIEIRAGLHVGNLARLLFLPLSPDYRRFAEHLWVRVTRVHADGTVYVGSLAQAPKYVPYLEKGANIEFEPKNVTNYL